LSRRKPAVRSWRKMK